MIADIDIWRAANLLVKGRGADAATVPAGRADELLAAGDVEGSRGLEANPRRRVGLKRKKFV